MQILSLISAMALLCLFFVVRWRCRECLKCSMVAASTLFFTVYISSAIYTWYLNVDSESLDKRAAIALAICNPIRNRSIVPSDISCGPTIESYGVALVISSGRVLDDAEIEEMIKRVGRLKPLITSGYVQVIFRQYEEKSSTSGVTEDGMPVKSVSYKNNTYKTINL